MFESTLPQIPRLLTALSEWLSCFTILMIMEKRWSKWITISLHLFFGMFIIISNYFAYITSKIEFKIWVLGVLGCVFIMFFYIAVCSKCSLSTLIGSCALAFTVAEFMASVEWQISCALLSSHCMKDIEVIILMLIILGLILFVVYYAENKIYNGNIRLEWKQSIILMVTATLAMIISNVGFQKIVWKNQVDLQSTLSFIRTLVDFGAIISIYLVQKSYHEQSMKLELASINYMLNLQYKQYRDFKANSEYISRQCHDLKYQIDVLRQACTEDEREKSLQEMEEAIKIYNAQNVTGNPVLDSILMQKKIYCFQNNIQFSCTADGRQLEQISVRDISIIFGNLIDNAIEYVIQLGNQEDRMIYGEVYQKNEFLMIKLNNCFYDKLEYMNELPVTSKNDKVHHGYGLKSVLYTVKKYHGTMRITAENGWFSVKILIPIKTENAI